MDKDSNAYCSMATISDSPPKSSSECSTPLPFSALSPLPTSSGGPRKHSIEEVWRDISLSSLHNPSSGTTISSSTTSGLALQGFSIQDLLSRSPPKGKQRTRPGHSTGHGGQRSLVAKSHDGFFAPGTPRVGPMLSLNTRMEIHSVERSHDPSSVKPQKQTIHDAVRKAPCSFALSRLDALNNSSSTVQFSNCKKRIPERDDSASSHRNKRMMKNRESAARSRARKQAYTTQLELEVARLKEANSKLRRQLEKLCTAVAPSECPIKYRLHRTLTGPI